MGLVLRLLAPVAGTMVIVLATMPLFDARAQALTSPLPRPAYVASRMDRDDPGDDPFFLQDDEACRVPDTITGRIQECDDATPDGRRTHDDATPDGRRTHDDATGTPTPDSRQTRDDTRADGRAGLLTLAAIAGTLTFAGAAYWLMTRSHRTSR